MHASRDAFIGGLHELCKPCAVRDRCLFAEVKSQGLFKPNVHHFHFRKREIVFHEGEPAFGLYVIHQGKAKVFKRVLDTEYEILGILGPADFVGEEVLLPNSTYLSSVQTLTETELLYIGRNDLQELMHDTAIAQRFLERLLLRLHHKGRYWLESMYGDADLRLCQLLLWLAHQHGRPFERNTILIDLELTQTELGQLIGLTREAVNKHLAILKEQGLVDFHGHQLAVDPVALGRILHYTLPQPSLADEGQVLL